MTDMVAPGNSLEDAAAQCRGYYSLARREAVVQRTAKKKSDVHFVYALIDPRDERVRYIGCSLDPWKRLPAHGTNADLHDVYSWVRELKSIGLTPRLAILDAGIGYLPTKRIEDRYIDEYDQFHGGLLNRHCPLVWKRKKAEAVQ